jgi:hypothetical protein
MDGLMGGQHDAGLDVAHVHVQRALQEVGIFAVIFFIISSLPCALMKAAPFSAMAMASFRRFDCGTDAGAGKCQAQQATRE